MQSSKNTLGKFKKVAGIAWNLPASSFLLPAKRWAVFRDQWLFWAPLFTTSRFARAEGKAGGGKG
jgi:hypothetical protein